MDILEMLALQYEPSVGNWHIGTVREMLMANFEALRRDIKYNWICMGIFNNRQQAEEALQTLIHQKRTEKYTGYVYFIEAVELGQISIGFSEEPEKRLSDLSRSSPYELRLIGKIPGDEEKQKEIHSMFEDIRFKREWFFATKKLREFIEEKRKLYQNESNGLFV